MANPSIMMKKSLFERNGLFEEGDFPEDYEFFLRLRSSGTKMRKVKRKVIKWYDSTSRLTRTDPRYAHNAFYKIKAQYLAKWLTKHNPFHPNIYIWGAGRLSRRRSEYLVRFGISIVQFIDVKRQPGIIHFEDIPSKEVCFIISFVANRGAREEIRSFLVSKSYQEGIHFILAS